MTPSQPKSGEMSDSNADSKAGLSEGRSSSEDLPPARPVTLDAIAHHGGCEDQRCRLCIEHSRLLDDELIRLTNDQRADLMGEYHGWLSRAGIAPETNGGWWSREALSDANAQRFATERAAFRRPLEHCECPACRATIHSSDCAVHNMPAMPNGTCDCGAACEAVAGAQPSNEKAVDAFAALLAASRKALGVLAGEDMNKQALIDALTMLRAAIALATKETT